MTGVEKVTARKMTPFKECGEGGWNDGCLDDNVDHDDEDEDDGCLDDNGYDDEEEDGCLDDNYDDGLEKKIT